MSRSKKVIIAMSGGVDSSLAAWKLQQQGHQLIGLFMHSGQKPSDSSTTQKHYGCSMDDANDARTVAELLNIPFHVVDFADTFDEIIDDFASEYARGRTPNPCVLCNMHIKFGKLFEFAKANGAEHVATGHYARIGQRDGKPVILRGLDPTKDQAYVLFAIEPARLGNIFLPIGEMKKEDVRLEAEQLGLPVFDKPDSQEICFAPDRDYAKIVRQRHPDAFQPGDVIDPEGNILGRHEGIPHYTIGQRRGLGIAAGHPIYVTHIDPDSNTITTGTNEHLMHRGLNAERVRFQVPMPPSFRASAKIRYLHKDQPAEITHRPDGTATILFDEPQRAITPGQAVVFFDNDVLLGGGWITDAFD